VSGILQTLTVSFKRELFCGFHAFDSEYRTADTFYIALYNAPTTLDYTITAYTTTGEASGYGYTAGGQQILPTTPAIYATTAAGVNFGVVTWTNSTITANCALIYNQTQNNRSVCVLSFGNFKYSSNNSFVVTPPVSGVLMGIN
jgi:hypothetical protein